MLKLVSVCKHDITVIFFDKVLAAILISEALAKMSMYFLWNISLSKEYLNSGLFCSIKHIREHFQERKNTEKPFQRVKLESHLVSGTDVYIERLQIEQSCSISTAIPKCTIDIV